MLAASEGFGVGVDVAGWHDGNGNMCASLMRMAALGKLAEFTRKLHGNADRDKTRFVNVFCINGMHYPPSGQIRWWGWLELN